MSGSLTKVAAGAAVALALSLGALGSSGQAAAAKPAALVVPTAFPTIQAAVDAARPGATIRVLRGTYTEQVLIGKPVTIVGAGMDKTVIRAPSDLQPNDAGETAIVDVTDGASVSMSHLTVAGPGTGTCDDGTLLAGVRVRNEADLNLRHAAVRDIHDTPFASCFHSSTAIFVGDVPGPTASATIDHSVITNYAGAGIVVLGFGSTATITHNRVAGPGAASGVSTGGIEFPVGAVGTISHNVVSGNGCAAADPTCGTDWFTQFQLAGIGAGGWGPGTVVTNNLVFDNQVGMLLGEVDELRDNWMVNNDFFGLALFDGNFVVDRAQIIGGGGGVWVIAAASDTTVELNHVRFAKLSGPEVGKVECCGFTATVTTNH